ncbi:MAG: LD-carboxypeptidase [Vicinamibacterales bacterium]
MNRRRFMESAVAAATLAGFTSHARGAAAAPRKAIKPKRLSLGDTVGIVAPASATFNTLDLQIARESLEALGLKVEVGRHVLDRHGYLAGQDEDRAADINRFFANPDVRAVLPLRGGWGASRVLTWLDYEAIRRNPKIVLGYSDITALHMAIAAKTGLITFHGPNGMGRWDAFSVNWVRRVLFDAEAVTLENLHDKGDFLVQTENRVQTIRPGTARGRILGGNLTVLTAIMGSPYVPDFTDAILFVEDVGEDIYRIDRMLTTLKLAGILGRLRGFVWGTCSECEPGSGFGSLTFEELFQDHIAPLEIPAWQGAMIGHRTPQFTIPEGVEVEIDATAGRIRMLEPAVM